MMSTSTQAVAAHRPIRENAWPLIAFCLFLAADW
jgi:hypothetical protein